MSAWHVANGPHAMHKQVTMSFICHGDYLHELHTEELINQDRSHEKKSLRIRRDEQVPIAASLSPTRSGFTPDFGVELIVFSK